MQTSSQTIQRLVHKSIFIINAVAANALALFNCVVSRTKVKLRMFYPELSFS